MPPSRRISLGPVIAAAGAVVLIVSLFLDWYGGLSGWTSFEVIDLVLVGIALASLVSLAEGIGITGTRARIVGSGAALPLGAAAVVIVASQLVNHPPAGVDRETEVGLWLGLAGAGLLLAGAALATARISLAVDVERREPHPEAATASRPPPPPRPSPPSRPPPPPQSPPPPREPGA
jgi:hypothetical protein